jgi:RNA polymerase sigma-70 factor (ECF subfamily)
MTDWSQIVHEYGSVVWKTAYRLLNNRADAEDCFQNAFVSALELSRTEAIRNWPAVLKRLATHRAIERLRERYRELGRLTPLGDELSVPGRVVEPPQAAEGSELAEHLRQALAKLDELQAQVFSLACLEEFSYQQIAEQLGLSVNHVGVLLNRARASLRERLRGHGPARDATCCKSEV